MALQIRHTFNGNLKNQGISFETPTYSGCTFVNGRGGKCLYTNKAYSSTTTYNGIKNLKKFTISCWVKLDSGQTFGNYADFFTVGFYTDDADYGGIRIEHTTVPGELQVVFGKSASFGASTNTWSIIFKSTEANHRWVNITITCDGTYIQLFMDGVLQSITRCSNIYNNGYMTGNICYGYNNASAYLSDFRIYDECLAEREIQEIANGLVLHYPMKQINRIVDALELADFSRRYDIGIGNGTNQCVDIGKVYTKDLKVGDVIYIQGYALFTPKTGDSIGSASGQSAGCWVQGSGDVTGWSSATFPSDGRKEVVASTNLFKGQCYISFDYTATINSDHLKNSYWNVNLRCDYVDNAKCSILYFYVTNGIKPHCYFLEKKYVRSKEVEFDTSGYKINAYVSETSNPIMKNIVTGKEKRLAYDFQDSKRYVRLLSGFPYYDCEDSFTISWWSKSNTTNKSMMPWGSGSGNGLNFYFTDGKMCWNTGNGSTNVFKNGSATLNSAPYLDGNWHHFVVTGNGHENLLYIDGTYAGESTFYRCFDSSSFYLGGEDEANYKWIGQLSDFRFYTSILSESEISRLYKSPVYITPNKKIVTHGEFVNDDDIEEYFINNINGINVGEASSMQIKKNGDIVCRDNSLFPGLEEKDSLSLQWICRIYCKEWEES